MGGIATIRRVGRRLLILTALEYEAKAIARRIGDAAGVELRVVGPGATRLPAAAELASFDAVIMAGVAGALDPQFQIGDVVVDGDIHRPAERWRRGKIYTSKTIAATAAQKAALFAETGALAVDMEHAAVRAWAEQAGVAFVGVRAISDRADEALDPAVLRLVDSSGRLRPGRLAAELCRRPTLVVALLRLRPRSALAVTNLADAVAQIVASPDALLSFSRAPGTTAP